MKDLCPLCSEPVCDSSDVCLVCLAGRTDERVAAGLENMKAENTRLLDVVKAAYDHLFAMGRPDDREITDRLREIFHSLSNQDDPQQVTNCGINEQSYLSCRNTAKINKNT